MDLNEYKRIENDINLKYVSELHMLRKEYVNSNAKFKIGDFVFNITGIIKVDRISYDIFRGNIEIHYFGYRYKKLHGEILRTKDNKISRLRESFCNKLEIEKAT